MSVEDFKTAFSNAVKEALMMAMETPLAERPAKLLAIRLKFKDHLINSGIDQATADKIMCGITIDVEVAADKS